MTTSNDEHRVICAMSGGVDSTVTAALLKEQGYEVIGLFMRNGVTHDDPDTRHQGCCSVEDSMDARNAASKLDIPFYAVNFERDFEQLIDYFVDEYNSGRTPNPCVRCNRTLKFGELMDYADELGASKVATGHYVKREKENGRYTLRRGEDTGKDQSYVLFNLRQNQLARSLFPLGKLEKKKVREMAEELELGVADKPDSTEICFVPGQDYRQILQERSPDEIETGSIFDTDGNELGDHPGHQHFTIGQRRGLGIATGKPMYVVEIDAEENAVIVGEREEAFFSGCVAGDVNWVSISPPEPGEKHEAEVQIRYNADSVPAEYWLNEQDELQIRFSEPIHGVSPGQAAVLYRDNLVLGGGWIASVTRNTSSS